MDRHQRQQHGGNALSPRGGGAAASGKHKGGKSAGKKPIKVVYISNPMRVKTSAEGFRAVVQELTGRHADPSKYSPELDLQGGAAVTVDNPEGPGAAAAPSHDSTASAAPAAEAANPNPYDVGAAAAFDGVDGGGGGYDDDDIFGSQLLDTNYTVLSPPTLLYDNNPYSKV